MMGHGDRPRNQDGLAASAYLARTEFAGLEWLPLATVVMDRDGTPLMSNAAWRTLAAATPAGPRGAADWLAAVDARDREPLRERLRTAAAGSRAEHVDVALAGSDGRRWTRWWWGPCLGRRLVVCVADLAGPPDPPPEDGQRPSEILVMADMVIRRLYGVGMILDSLAAAPAGDPASIRVARAARELDSVIRDVRSAAFRAHQVPPPQGEEPGP